MFCAITQLPTVTLPGFVGAPIGVAWCGSVRSAQRTDTPVGNAAADEARFLDILELMGPTDPRTAAYRKQLTAQGKTHAFDDARFKGASVLVANSNFGCGSSREHAAWALERLVQGVIPIFRSMTS